MGIEIDTRRVDVPDLLVENEVQLETINSIVFSHWHFDHLGDPTRFPSTSSLAVGPGFKQHCLPGYPTNLDSMIPDKAFGDREVREIAFDSSNSGLRIAGVEAIHWFGDGSFYLLNTPGHAIGHLGALTRTKAVPESTGAPASFILLVGDMSHHAGELRPSQLQTLPSIVPPDTGSHHTYQSSSAYCTLYTHDCPNRPFYSPSAAAST